MLPYIDPKYFASLQKRIRDADKLHYFGKGELVFVAPLEEYKEEPKPKSKKSRKVTKSVTH